MTKTEIIDRLKHIHATLQAELDEAGANEANSLSGHYWAGYGDRIAEEQDWIAELISQAEK